MKLISPRCAHVVLLRMFVTSVFLLLSLGSLVTAQSSDDLKEQLEKATRKISGDEKFELKYAFHDGEILYYEVIHQTAVDTTVQANTEQVKSRSKSLKKWEFSDVNSNGDAKLAHSIEWVNMWSEMSGREAVHYDSRKDKKAPPDYATIAKSLGTPISNVEVTPFGKITARKDKVKQIDRGTGGLLVPLPPAAVPIGTEWAVAGKVPVSMTDGRTQVIKTRQRYRLEKVETGIATISLKTQVLTPVSEGRVKSQLIQKLSNGVIKFDIDAGRIVSKDLKWDETVISFNGPESNMSFLARMTERLVPAAEVASLQDPPK